MLAYNDSVGKLPFYAVKATLLGAIFYGLIIDCGGSSDIGRPILEVRPGTVEQGAVVRINLNVPVPRVQGAEADATGVLADAAWKYGGLGPHLSYCLCDYSTTCKTTPGTYYFKVSYEGYVASGSFAVTPNTECGGLTVSVSPQKAEQGNTFTITANENGTAAGISPTGGGALDGYTWKSLSSGKWSTTFSTNCSTDPKTYPFSVAVNGIGAVNSSFVVTSNPNCSATGLSVSPTSQSLIQGDYNYWQLVKGTTGNIKTTSPQASGNPTVSGLPSTVNVYWQGTDFGSNGQWQFQTKVNQTTPGTYPFTVSYGGQTANATLTVQPSPAFSIQSWSPQTISASACSTNAITFIGYFPGGTANVAFKASNGDTLTSNVQGFNAGQGTGPQSLQAFSFACPMTPGSYAVTINGNAVGTLTVTN